MMTEVADVETIEDETQEQPVVAKRILVLETDGATVQLKALTMPVLEALKVVEKVYAHLQAVQQNAEKAAVEGDAAKPAGDDPA